MAIKIFEKNKLDSLFTSTIINDFFIWEKIKKTNLLLAIITIQEKLDKILKINILENGSFYIFNTKNLKDLNVDYLEKLELL